MRTLINSLNFFTALFAFLAAVLWILSGGLGQVSIQSPSHPVTQNIATAAAKFNTDAAWMAALSALFAMASSIFSIRGPFKRNNKNEPSENNLQKLIDDHREAEISKKLEEAKSVQAEIKNSNSVSGVRVRGLVGAGLLPSRPSKSGVCQPQDDDSRALAPNQPEHPFEDDRLD